MNSKKQKIVRDNDRISLNPMCELAHNLYIRVGPKKMGKILSKKEVK
jgi:hypothetical protein